MAAQRPTRSPSRSTTIGESAGMKTPTGSPEAARRRLILLHRLERRSTSVEALPIARRLLAGGVDDRPSGRSAFSRLFWSMRRDRLLPPALAAQAAAALRLGEKACRSAEDSPLGAALANGTHRCARSRPVRRAPLAEDGRHGRGTSSTRRSLHAHGKGSSRHGTPVGAVRRPALVRIKLTRSASAPSAIAPSAARGQRAACTEHAAGACRAAAPRTDAFAVEQAARVEPGTPEARRRCRSVPCSRAPADAVGGHLVDAARVE